MLSWLCVVERIHVSLSILGHLERHLCLSSACARLALLKYIQERLKTTGGGACAARDSLIIMKMVDMSLVTLIHSGEGWSHEQPPCSRQMIHLLERNEAVVTWVQVRACPTRETAARVS